MHWLLVPTCPHSSFVLKCDFLRQFQFQRFWSADWSPATETLSSNWIQLMWHFKIANITESMQNPIENCKTNLMSLLSYQKSPASHLNKTRSKFWIIMGGKYLGIHLLSLPGIPSSSSATFWNPNQNRLKASLIANILSKGLIRIRPPVQKLQQLMPLFIGNNTVYCFDIGLEDDYLGSQTSVIMGLGKMYFFGSALERSQSTRDRRFPMNLDSEYFWLFSLEIPKKEIKFQPWIDPRLRPRNCNPNPPRRHDHLRNRLAQRFLLRNKWKLWLRIATRKIKRSTISNQSLPSPSSLTQLSSITQESPDFLGSFWSCYYFPNVWNGWREGLHVVWNLWIGCYEPDVGSGCSGGLYWWTSWIYNGL